MFKSPLIFNNIRCNSVQNHPLSQKDKSMLISDVRYQLGSNNGLHHPPCTNSHPLQNPTVKSWAGRQHQE